MSEKLCALRKIGGGGMKIVGGEALPSGHPWATVKGDYYVVTFNLSTDLVWTGAEVIATGISSPGGHRTTLVRATANSMDCTSQYVDTVMHIMTS